MIHVETANGAKVQRRLQQESLLDKRVGEMRFSRSFYEGHVKDAALTFS